MLLVAKVALFVWLVSLSFHCSKESVARKVASVTSEMTEEEGVSCLY